MAPMPELVLGLNSAHADSSAALVGPGGVLAAIAEERINREKHCSGFPGQAIAEVLRISGADLRDIRHVAIARDGRANLVGKLAFLARHPRSGLPQAWRRLGVHRKVTGTLERIAEALGQPHSAMAATLHRVEHHKAHISSAFYWSPFESATGISVDGAGDFASHMVARCQGTEVVPVFRSLWPHSLGVYYTAVCQFIGFDRFGEEYKVMGLSAYGEPTLKHKMSELVRFDDTAGIQLNLDYFCHQTGQGLEVISSEAEVSVPRLWGASLESLLGKPRKRDEPLRPIDYDIAASMQAHFEDVYLKLVASAVRRVGSREVVFAGGSVLNSVANGRVINEGLVDKAYFHPAASDDGTAMGAALHVAHHKLGWPRTPAVRHAYWGSEFGDDEIEAAAKASQMPYERLDRDALIERAADFLARGSIMGWFQGREEWGPRALGNRSILCHPGWPDMKAILNARIKNREPFRPFAPAILGERLSECFEGSHEVPFMNVVYKVKPAWRERLAAVTHEDGTGRVQTVYREDNSVYYDLISAFEKRTQIPVLLNTSFNENEPIVHTPAQAIDCFKRTRMDALGIGSFWLSKG